MSFGEHYSSIFRSCETLVLDLIIFFIHSRNNWPKFFHMHVIIEAIFGKSWSRTTLYMFLIKGCLAKFNLTACRIKTLILFDVLKMYLDNENSLPELCWQKLFFTVYFISIIDKDSYLFQLHISNLAVMLIFSLAAMREMIARAVLFRPHF